MKMPWSRIAAGLAHAFDLPNELRARLAVIEEKIDRIGSEPGSINVVASWLSPEGLPRIESFERKVLPREKVRWDVPDYSTPMRPPVFVVCFGGRLECVSYGNIAANLGAFGRFAVIGESVAVGVRVSIVAVAT